MYSRILVPVDGSPTSNAGLDEAIKLAKQFGSRLRLLHVVDQMPLAVSAEGFGVMSVDVLGLLKEAGERVLADAKARVDAAGVPVDTLLVDSPNSRLSDHVTAVAKEWPAELIVIGTHGRRGIGRVLMGSDAEQVVRHAPVPVLLYRAVEGGQTDAASA
ncbi:MAG: universal stress protein [Rhodoferax sp.]|jgi:nucleotide-binding universal stress UspA family protein|nr:universal stress protein [Rhodoferax sp.]